MSSELFRQFEVQRPKTPVPPYGLILLQKRVITPEEAIEKGSAFCLWKYLHTIASFMRNIAIRETILRQNQTILRHEMDIPTDQELAQKIMREYSRINM